MAIGSGLGAQIGIAAESTYGTYAAPTKFVEFTKESIKLKKTTAQSAGIAAGRLVALSSRRVVTQKEAQGSLEMEVTNKSMGVLLQSTMGTTVTPVQQTTTTAYLQTHTLADTAGKSLTVQKGVPRTDGTVMDYSVLGCKVTSAEFSCEVGGMLTASFDLDGKTVDETQTLAAPSYPLMTPFHFGQMAVKLGTFGTETALDGIRKVTVKIDRPLAVDRFYAGAAGLKAEPVTNDLVKISGSLEADFLATTLADLFVSDAPKSLVWEFTGDVIEGAQNYLFRVTLPAIHIDDEPPTVEGPEIIRTTFAFTGLFDGTNPNKIEYKSTDTTV
ncbi:phage tail tube protein [Stenotrophomonas sp. NPDC087984]